MFGSMVNGVPKLTCVSHRGLDDLILREVDDGTFTEKPCRLEENDTARKTHGFPVH